MSQDKPLQYFVIRSPYAQLILTGVKTFEFRTNAKMFANKRLAISVSKTPGADMMLQQELAYWEKQLNKSVRYKSQEEKDEALAHFKKACSKAEKLFEKTNGNAMIIGEVETGDEAEFAGDFGVPILSFKLWPESEWIASPGGLGVRYMPGVKRPETDEPKIDATKLYKSPFARILDKYRSDSISERDKGNKFELLMQRFLQTDPVFSSKLETVWLWNDFFAKDQFGGKDVGIDLVAKTIEGNYWAIQCKCYKADKKIDKPAVDTFLSTSGKVFADEDGKKIHFAYRLWLDTTENGFNQEALNSTKNQDPEFHRFGLIELEESLVDWEKLDSGLSGDSARVKKKSPLDHQKEAIAKVHEYFKDGTRDRGKLIMACGTGKTYTSLCIAEKETDGKGTILFLVPSIALLGQTLREWSADATDKIKPICICSDAGVSKKSSNDSEGDGYSVEELALPASTNVSTIVKQLQVAQSKKGGMTVVFSTYQSIDVISEAQHKMGKDFVFDMIVCDEAHRTTGAMLSGREESNFVKVHDSKFLRAKKRIYMTATPRLYSEASKKKAEEGDAFVWSMDDEKYYGEEMFRIGFGEAVDKNLLSDYKVLVLTIDPEAMSESLQKSLATDSGEMLTDDEAKLIGCFNALSKITLVDDHLLKETDPQPMHRAVAFSQTIKISKELVETINDLHDTYYNNLKPEAKKQTVRVSAKHIDGGMNASLRDAKLRWLKGDVEENECRILNNVRCLSEGVDVPSLDAVLFLSARDSEVDVVQSVGRVMRKAKDKKYGYIIIPVIVPAGEKAEDALDKNDRFKVVWKILNALRAHDDRFNAMVNKIQFNTPQPGKSRTGGRVGVSSGLPASDTENLSPNEKERQRELQDQLELKFQELQGAIYAKMVEKVGSRRYWETWAQDVARIAQRHEQRIKKLIATEGKHQKAFKGFVSALQKNINPSITEQKAIETLSQHLITKPVFDALFEGYDFAKNNPVSRAMQKVINLLEENVEEEDVRSLEGFYKSVKLRAEGVESAEGKQRIIIELYDKFFKTALPKTVEQLGIVYTPVECVDFIIHSVNDILRQEFGRKLSDENVNIIDPFTGTGTFITRLIQSGLINKKDLERKYTKELKANEIVLLAYYIASVNIENAYHDAMNADDYKPFEGICLTDTFQLGEKMECEDFGEDFFPINGPRARAQRKVPIQVVIGNPPYSIGQKSTNDNISNYKYPDLEKRVDASYAQLGGANNKNALYDSYIKAFRWATDRIDSKSGGVIGFITNGGWLDGGAMDGFRKCLEDEFSKIYVFNLRGNARTQGELRRKERDNVFGMGTRTPVAITILVKKPANQIKAGEKAVIKYFDIGDYLTREQKLAKIKEAESITHLEMTVLHPNAHGDWINQRNESFSKWTQIEPSQKFDKSSKSWFVVQSLGIGTNRDPWMYNSSKMKLNENVKKTISFYNKEVDRCYPIPNGKKIEDVVSYDATKISWTSSLLPKIEKGIKVKFEDNVVYNLYRPFFKQYLSWNKPFIHRTGQNKEFFPDGINTNKVIVCSGIGSSKNFSCIITDCMPNMQLVFNDQCFPLYYYEELDSSDMFASKDKYVRKDAVSDYILKQARIQYDEAKIRKEDIFYYVYGFLHCEEYRSTFAADLKKMLPRIPLVDNKEDFWAFSKAGRKLAELHLNYETVKPYDATIVSTSSKAADLPIFAASKSDARNLYKDVAPEQLYRVVQMKFDKLNSKEKDKSKIIYNERLSIANIPVEAYEYEVNGKSAIEWLMERYAITTDKASGIVNDPNDWAIEHNNPSYIFDLVLRIITVSIETMKIVKALPKVQF